MDCVFTCVLLAYNGQCQAFSVPWQSKKVWTINLLIFMVFTSSLDVPVFHNTEKHLSFVVEDIFDCITNLDSY